MLSTTLLIFLNYVKSLQKYFISVGCTYQDLAPSYLIMSSFQKCDKFSLFEVMEFLLIRRLHIAIVSLKIFVYYRIP